MDSSTTGLFLPFLESAHHRAIPPLLDSSTTGHFLHSWKTPLVGTSSTPGHCHYQAPLPLLDSSTTGHFLNSWKAPLPLTSSTPRQRHYRAQSRLLDRAPIGRFLHSWTAAPPGTSLVDSRTTGHYLPSWTALLPRYTGRFLPLPEIPLLLFRLLPVASRDGLFLNFLLSLLPRLTWTNHRHSMQPTSFRSYCCRS